MLLKGCNKVLAMDIYLRIVNKIPYLKPFGDNFGKVN
jgi:hypothetical protein